MTRISEPVETTGLAETDAGTGLTWRLRFPDQAGRAHMTRYDGIESSFDDVAAYLRSLLAAEGSTSG